MLDLHKCYRLKALFYLLIFILTTPFYCILTAILWTSYQILKALKITKKPSPKLLPPDKRRTVLVTDSPNTKTLHVIRVLGKVGHRIILVDSKRYKSCAASWSKYVERTIYVSHHNGPRKDEYIDEVIQVALDENIDWFIPVSKIPNAIPNCIIAERLTQLRPNIRCLDFGDVEFARKLDHKIDFLSLCKSNGISVPDFRVIDWLEDLKKLREENFFDQKHYFLKSADNDLRVDRLNFKRIPSELNAFNEYIKEFEPKFTTKGLYFVCEYIKGREWASNAICREGKVMSLEVIPSGCHPMVNDYVKNQAIKDWTLQFCSKLKINGGLCFDLIQDDITGKVYCIECNPRLHTAITTHHENPKFALAFQAALEPESIVDQVEFPIEPPSNSPRVYWLYLELHQLFTFHQGIGEFVWNIRNGRDAIYDNEDPLPFLIANTIHPFVQLTREIINGAPCGIFYPIIGRMTRY